ncbi:MAG: nucleotidyltransferase domain-containing protein [Methanospirillum sp.]
MIPPLRLRDFVEDADGWLYAVAAYDNAERAGCVLRYVPDPAGDRVRRGSGVRYRKLDFAEAYARVAAERPHCLDLLHRVPLDEIAAVHKPEAIFPDILARDERVRRLANALGLAPGTAGCTGSLLVGLEGPGSDIDLVVYGAAFDRARARLPHAVREGLVDDLSEELWRRVYAKRRPALVYEEFRLHEARKWNRGEIGGTYFDLLFTRDYAAIDPRPIPKGPVIGKAAIEATVTDATLAYDLPAVYDIDHPEVARVLSFTHTYSGQALAGEVIEAAGVLEQHGDECWLVVGTCREPVGEYILSRTLLESF